jgi:hypothetical protein
MTRPSIPSRGIPTFDAENRGIDPQLHVRETYADQSGTVAFG